jgi:hypothetical protein
MTVLKTDDLLKTIEINDVRIICRHVIVPAHRTELVRPSSSFENSKNFKKDCCTGYIYRNVHFTGHSIYKNLLF